MYKSFRREVKLGAFETVSECYDQCPRVLSSLQPDSSVCKNLLGELRLLDYYSVFSKYEMSTDRSWMKRSQFEELTYKKKPDLSPASFEAYAKKKFISWFERRVKPDKEVHDKFKDMIEGVYVQGTCYNEIDGNYYGRLEEVVKLTYRNGDALQQEESNASMSHVETIIIDNPANFFIDLTNISTNDEDVPDNEENVPEKDNSSDDKSGESEEDSS
ncbi:hypothetical protein POM88_048928 [Heracleum sosnowskyi]|uniref:Uncharacterized protein n=1 Tax=Heracleum sosnowskyi TaxID=360622 RepID=A0AAD8GUP1_9APIA|nr:hypothetical protein POM88_048928 [Heracleum sosnowskyi]